MAMDLKKFWPLVKQAASAWSDDYAPSMGAALAYYTLFSIAPLLLITIAVAGLVFGADAARGQIVTQLTGLMGQQGAQAIQSLLEGASRPKDSAWATLVGAVLLLVGATTVFAELQDALDRIWRAPARRESGLWSLLRTRLLSFGLILGLGFLLLVSLVLGAVLAAFETWWSPLFGGWGLVASIANLAVSFGLVTVMFAMIYKLMPRVRIRWHDVWIGAAVTAALFSVGKYLIGLYIGKSGVATTFGAAGSMVVLLLWVYYSAQIFLMGAEFTWVYAHTFGSLRVQAPVTTTPTVPPKDVPTRSAGTAPNDPAAALRPGGGPATPVRQGQPGPTASGAPDTAADSIVAWRKIALGLLAGGALGWGMETALKSALRRPRKKASRSR